MKRLRITACVVLAVIMSSAYATDETNTAVGVQLHFMPKYDGASTYRFIPLPIIDYKNGTFFISGLGAGMRYPLGSGFSAGLITQFDFGRNPDDSTRLASTAGVSNTMRVGAFVDWKRGPWYVSVKALQATHSGYGLDVRLDTMYTLAFTPRDRIQLGAGTTWGNGAYMNTYFGVSPREAINSRFALTPYSPSSGLKDIDASVRWIHRFDTHWSSVAMLGLSTLISDAADSPIVENRVGWFGTVGVTYRF